MDKLAEIAALWAEWKSALKDQRSAWFEQAALRAANRRIQIERDITGTPATTPLGGLIKLAVHEFNADETARISSTYRALAAVVGREPIASTSIASHLQLTAWRTRPTRRRPSSEAHQRSVAQPGA
jgi:hypothetical protein